MRRSFILALLVTITAVGCRFLRSAAPPQGEVSQECDNAAGISVVTYNAGLAPGLVPYSAARTDLVAQAVAGANADILCMQEVWSAADKEAVIDRLGLPPANVFTVDTSGEGETGEDRCEPGDLDGIKSCVRRSCPHATAEEVAMCAVKHCGMQGLWLYIAHRHCLNCIIAEAGHSVAETEHACVDGPGASRIYHGQNGIVLASKYPLRNREVIRLPSSGANRVALIATVDTGKGPPLEVGCTHLSSATVTSPTDKRFSSWEDEQAAQIDLVTERLTARAKASGHPMLFVGDMNAGQAAKGLDANQLKTWEHLTRLDYRSPAEEALTPFCTSCADNQLRDSDTNCLIDHVLLRAVPGTPSLAPVCAMRVFDDEVWLRPTRAKTVLGRRSDHYGLKVVLRLR